MGLHRELELMAEMDQVQEENRTLKEANDAWLALFNRVKIVETRPWRRALLIGVVLSWALGVYTGVRAAADRVVPVPVPAEIMTYKGFIGPLGVQVTWRSGR